MFRTKKTKIISTPVEEVLEVEDPFVEEVKNVVLPQQVANIEFLTVDSNNGDIHYGTLIDYDENLYHYQWDNKSKRIMRLIGVEINKLTWDLCDDVLQKYFVKAKKPKAKEPIGPQIESIIKDALVPVSNAFKNIDNKLDKALIAKTTPTPIQPPMRTQQPQQVQRPQTIQASSNHDAPAINVADDDISINALRFLENSQDDGLGIDYMSL